MLAAWEVIRSESGAPITTPILLEGGFFVCLRAANALEEVGSSNLCNTFWSNLGWIHVLEK